MSRPGSQTHAVRLPYIRLLVHGGFSVVPAINTRARTSVRYASTALALAGWGGGLWSYLVHGFEAGVHPGFIAALSVGIAFTMVAGQWWMLPTRDDREEHAALFALGVQRGIELAGAKSHDPEPSRLTVVR